VFDDFERFLHDEKHKLPVLFAAGLVHEQFENVFRVDEEMSQQQNLVTLWRKILSEGTEPIHGSVSIL
jgi:hypothetical protein